MTRHEYATGNLVDLLSNSPGSRTEDSCEPGRELLSQELYEALKHVEQLVYMEVQLRTERDTVEHVLSDIEHNLAVWILG